MTKALEALRMLFYEINEVPIGHRPYEFGHLAHDPFVELISYSLGKIDKRWCIAPQVSDSRKY